MSLAAWLSGNVIKETPSLISGSAMAIFSNGKLFQDVYGPVVSVFVSFVHVLSFVVFGGGPCTILTTDQ